MVTDSLQLNILERFRQRQGRLGSVVFTLFMAVWLNLLVQPCLMAAPINDCDNSVMHHQTALLSGSAQDAGATGSTDFEDSTASLSMDCASMDCELVENCVDGAGSYSAVGSPDLEKKFLASSLAPVASQSSAGTLYLPLGNQKPVFSRVPLFIQNCAFLI